MTIIHRVAEPKDLERLGPMLDNEFILSKGRKKSIAQRFPSTFCAANISNIFLAEENGNIVSAFLAKRFVWQHAARKWQGAMIGAVYADPTRRGEGLGSALLKWGTQALKEAGVEFAVLWTTQTQFYERLGWAVSDIGMFGNSHSGVEAGGVLDSIKAQPLVMSNDREINDIRMQYLDALVLRQTLDYSQQPIPAESVDVLFWSDDGESSSYAIAGRLGTTGILYEMVGSDDGFSDLWQSILQRYQKVMINDSLNSRSYRWLSQHTDVVWESKKLAMWMPLSAELDISAMSKWYIPYFDRI